MKIVAHDFAPRDLVAGNVALDFVNTVTARDTPRPLDRLDTYGRLLDWAELAVVIDPATSAKLHKLAAGSPRQAGAALARARRLREALHQTCAALAEEKAAPPAALAEIESGFKRAIERAKLARFDRGLAWEPNVAVSGLDFVHDAVALSAMKLLKEFAPDRTRVCRGHACGWLFIDTSKGGRRVWCDMSTCGNVAKSRRHQARHRA